MLTVAGVGNALIFGGTCGYQPSGNSICMSPNASPRVYPNPFTDQVRVEGVDEGTNYTIMTREGRALERGVIRGGAVAELGGLPHGVYLLRVDDRAGPFVRRIVK